MRTIKSPKLFCEDLANILILLLAEPLAVVDGVLGTGLDGYADVLLSPAEARSGAPMTLNTATIAVATSDPIATRPFRESFLSLLRNTSPS